MSGIINYTSSPTSTTSQLEYPNAPPTENQVKNELNNATLIDASKTKQTFLFCFICDFPISVRVVLNPCNHIMCYSCYTLHPNECKLCEEDIVSITRLPDSERVPYSEDAYGFPVYKPNMVEEK